MSKKAGDVYDKLCGCTLAMMIENNIEPSTKVSRFSDKKENKITDESALTATNNLLDNSGFYQEWKKVKERDGMI